MNTISSNTDSPNTEDRRFDRLVDNELSEAERRELLTGLDDEPGGWRRCALAFLEAQCWKTAFRSVAKESVPPAPAVKESIRLWSAAIYRRFFCDGWPARDNVGPSTESGDESPHSKNAEKRTAAKPASRGRSVWLGRAEMSLAMAASFGAALLVASWFQQNRAPVGRTGGTGPGNQVAVVPAPGNQSPGPTGGAQGTPSPDGPWQMVTLTEPSSRQNGTASLQLPAVERKNVDDAWLRSLPPAIPDDVLHALSRSGYKIQQRRELMPVPMKDGRRLVVPVDQVELHYIGNGAY